MFISRVVAPALYSRIAAYACTLGGSGYGALVAVEKDRAHQLVVYLSPGVGYGAVPIQSLATRLSGFCCAPNVKGRRGRCPCLIFYIRITPYCQDFSGNHVA